MKKKISTLLLLSLLLGSMLLSLSSCDELGKKKEPSPEENAPAAPYEIVYVSNGNGTCYVSQIITNPDYKEPFVLQIPETSPDGDTVTAVKAKFDTHVPRFLLPEDFDRIERALKAKMDSGELEIFYYHKILKGFFIHRSLSEQTTAKAKEALLKEYPITELTDIYEYAPDALPTEDFWVSSYLYFYADFTPADTVAGYQRMLDLINNSSATNKADMIADVPVASRSYGTAIKEIVLPKTVTEVDPRLFGTAVYLETVNIPDCITELPVLCTGMSHLNAKTVTLPKSIVKIHDDGASTALDQKVIYYKGTKADWEKITWEGENKWKETFDQLVQFVPE